MPILFFVFKKHLTMKDTAIGIVSIVSAILCSYGFSLSTKSWMVYVAAAVGVLRGLHAVAARSVLTGRVEKGEIGKMMAITSSIQALSPTLTGGILLNVFGATAGWWPGFCFAVAASSFLFSLASFCYIDVDRRDSRYGESRWVSGKTYYFRSLFHLWFPGLWYAVRWPKLNYAGLKKLPKKDCTKISGIKARATLAARKAETGFYRTWHHTWVFARSWVTPRTEDKHFKHPGRLFSNLLFRAVWAPFGSK